MCLIVDVNVAHRVLLVSDDPDFKDVHICLFTNSNPKGSLVYGGKLTDEYSRNHEIIRTLVKLDQAGRARKADDDLVNEEMERIIQSGLCESNDEHIIALARVGRVRLLCSHDKDLHADFTNKALLDKPRGKVYQKPRHKNLLSRFCG
ncbi:MAG: hypothetical protein L0229_29625 [Blastocatellia bacterium]|nr:hypothetical protein [Blastocatellia bacterium]